MLAEVKVLANFKELEENQRQRDKEEADSDFTVKASEELWNLILTKINN